MKQKISYTRKEIRKTSNWMGNNRISVTHAIQILHNNS